jgi:hypothetical protein
MMIKIDMSHLRWESDWNGHEVGHDDVLVVGLYRLADTNTYFYIDMETNEIVEYWSDEMDDEE